jgi:hypothetical protein
MADANKSGLVDCWIIGLLVKSKPDNFHQSINPVIHQSIFYA